jgi:hypothetical protein
MQKIDVFGVFCIQVEHENKRRQICDYKEQDFVCLLICPAAVHIPPSFTPVKTGMTPPVKDAGR